MESTVTDATVVDFTQFKSDRDRSSFQNSLRDGGFPDFFYRLLTQPMVPELRGELSLFQQRQPACSVLLVRSAALSRIAFSVAWMDTPNFIVAGLMADPIDNSFAAAHVEEEAQLWFEDQEWPSKVGGYVQQLLGQLSTVGKEFHLLHHLNGNLAIVGSIDMGHLEGPSIFSIELVARPCPD